MWSVDGLFSSGSAHMLIPKGNKCLLLFEAVKFWGALLYNNRVEQRLHIGSVKMGKFCWRSFLLRYVGKEQQDEMKLKKP